MKKSLLYYFVTFTLGLMASSAQASSTYYWTGLGLTNSWTNAANWFNSTTNSINGYPGSSSTSDIAQVDGNSISINLTNSITIATLTTPNYGIFGLTISFSGNPTLTINSGLNIAQPLLSSMGIIFTGAGTAVINNSVSFGYEAGMYIGPNATVTFNTPVTSFNGAPPLVNDGTLNINNVAFNPGNITTNDATGTINITGSNAVYTTSNNIINAGTINCAGGIISTSASITNSGTINCTGAATISTSGAASVITNTKVLTLSSSTLTLINTNNYLTNSAPGVITASASAIDMAGAGTYITNSGTFNATNTTFSFGNQNKITNSGSFTTQGTCAFGLTSSSNCTIANTGTYKDHGSVYTLSGQTATITNSGPSASFAARGTTFNISANAGNITNSSSATFTADSASAINLTGYAAQVNNSAYFNAGTSGSVCVITVNNQPANTTTGASVYNSSYFNLGSTSLIQFGTAYNERVYNAGTFTLMSDANGSASFGGINGSSTASIGGIYNVQRFMTGGSPAATYRSYRLLSSPTNTNSIVSGNTNYIDFSNFSNTATKNKYTVYTGPASSTTYYGAFTGGITGFTVANGYPTIYLYRESLNPTAATKNINFITGKYAGLTSISGSAIAAAGSTNGSDYTLSYSGIPVGNGFLIYYVGSINGRTTGSPAIAPDNATITNAGYINQNNVPVYLWFTPSVNTLSYTNTMASYNFMGYSMVGNPYPSTINLQQVYADNYNSGTNAISSNFYELNNKTPQSFVVYSASGGSSGNSCSQYIVSGQGFMVSATATGQTLTFKEDQKVYNNTLTPTSTPALDLSLLNPAQKALKSLSSGLKSAALINPQDTLHGLHMKLSSDNTTSFDECGIYFSKNCKDTYDAYDAYDLDGINPQVYMSSFTADGARVALNKMSDYSYGKRVKLYVRAVSDGICHLSMEDFANIDTTNFNIFLIDNEKGDSLDMVRYKTYSFNLIAADTSAFANRFVLAIERKFAAPYSLVNLTGQKANSGIQLDWKTSNEGDYTGFGLEKLGANGQYTLIDTVQSNGAGLYTFNDQNPVTGNNIYRLEQNDINGKVTFAGPINISYNAISVSGMFTIYPNPSKDIINVSVNSATAGNATMQTYLANIYNLGGTLLNTRQLNTNNFTQDITGYKAGVYILELKSLEGDVIGKAKFIKTN